MKKQFSRILATVLAFVLVLGMMPLSALATDTATYTVSGNVPGSGSITATNADGEEQVFENALVDGSYSVSLADGTYSLYFDCGDYEGMIPTVTVAGADVTADLSKTYQKLASLKYGDAGTANWVLIDNGCYEVQTSNASADSISMGWFKSGITIADTDFVIETNVEAAGTNNVMIGLAMQGINANGAQRTLVYGLNNANYTAQCRVMENNTWPGQRTISYEYDRTNFHVKYVKQGSTITCYVDGEQVAQWTSSSSDFVFMGLTDTKVGVGIYRTYDVTFSDYSYSRINTVSGTVAGNASGNVTATDANGEETVFEGALVDGSYSIELPDSTYDLYFDCGTAEGLLNDVVVNEADVSANLEKTYQKLTPMKVGTDGTAEWVLTENGRYEVATSNSSANTVSMGYFAENVTMADTDFVIKTNVKAAGTNNVLIGLAISGKDSAGSEETAVFGLFNNKDAAQLRTLIGNGWLAYKVVANSYDKTDFDLIIVKNGDNISYYIDGVKTCEWYASDYDFLNWTETRVGLGFYRMYDVNFSEYSYSTAAEDVSAVKGYAVTYGELPEGVTVSVKSDSVVLPGTAVTVNGLTNEDLMYTVKVNGQQIVQSNGTAQFIVDATSTVEVTATEKVTSFAVSGTAPGTGTVTANGENGEEFICALENGSYSMMLPNGTYSLYFDCGDTEGLIPAVTVSGAEVTANLSKTYQKLTSLKYGDAGTANWVLTDNGCYEVQTSNTSADSISMGWFNSGITMADTDFVIETNVEAAGTNNVMIGLAIQGINANGAQRTLVYGLNNANYTAQCRVMENNTWPGQRTISYEYDRTNFYVKYVKQGNTITCYVDGQQVAQWTSSSSDFVFMGLTDAKVGIGIYRMYDVTFSDYSYEASYAVSGTVAGNVSGSVTATDANGNEQVFENALVDGSYKVFLPNGTYDLYFDCDNREGMIADVVVSDSVVTADLAKTYQKLTSYQIGVDGTAQWVLTDNGRYEVTTSNSSVNTVSMGYFASNVNLDTTDFVIETNVEAAGTNNVMIGLVISKSDETVVYGLNNKNNSAQIRVLEANEWPGYQDVASYDRTNFALKIVKSGATITYFINGTQTCQWTASDYDFSGWTETTVGLGFYRMFDVTFSDYSYTETKAEVNKWNLVLDDDLKVNYYLNLDRYTAADANVNITVGGDTVSYKASELTVENALYVASINIAAAQMTEDIVVSVVNGDQTLVSNTYTIRGYCDTVLADEAYSAYHALIKEMLAYGGAAQTYFGYNTDYLASDGITDTGASEVPESAETEMVISGEADGIAFYGASLIFRDKIAVRFYFTGSSEDIEGAVVKNDMFYIEVADILPQDLDKAVTVTVNGLTVSYSPMNYIVRMNEKGSENLQALLKALYNYHLAAKALRA